MFRVLGWNGENLHREQLGKQFLGSHRNPERGYRQTSISSPKSRKVFASIGTGWLGWLTSQLPRHCLCLHQGQPCIVPSCLSLLSFTSQHPHLSPLLLPVRVTAQLILFSSPHPHPLQVLALCAHRKPETDSADCK